ncbi:hypothetical protein AAG906_014642 [Vitis piasezkii]
MQRLTSHLATLDCKSFVNAINHYLIEPPILSSLEEMEELYMYLDVSNYASICLNFPASNNETKYEAVMVGLELALTRVASKVEIQSDSQLVVGQIQHEYKAGDKHMAPYLNSVESHLAKLANL